MNFSEARQKFHTEHKAVQSLSKSLVTVDGKFVPNISIKDAKGQPNEEFYKWEFIYALIASKLYPRDCIGAEIYFPKGNINSAPIKIDTVIFSSVSWIDYYRKYRDHKDQDALEELRRLAIAVIEYKREGKVIEKVFSSQIKAAIKEPDADFVLGVYYDSGRLHLFKRVKNEISRYNNSLNVPKSQRVLERFQLEITDPYYLIPSHSDLLHIRQSHQVAVEHELKVEDLDTIYTISDENIKGSLNQILRTLDSVSLFNEKGYLILIQLIAVKIYDEKQSELHGSLLRFFIRQSELLHNSLEESGVQEFVTRLKGLYAEAKRYYKNILLEEQIDWKNIRHVRAASEIVRQFQIYSFAKSRKTDLYQLVFYNFATRFKKDENAQFLTPLPIIDFMVRILNPRRNETVCDPCCGIADFLSMSYINSDAKLDDHNLFGFDNDYNMTILAQLNMLLNGDGNANIYYAADKGSIDHKLTVSHGVRQLNTELHASGNWDNWADDAELMRYDVILTNPPFGKGRSLDLNKSGDRKAAELYELYHLYIKENPKAGLDLGAVFLENAVRTIKVGGRFGIVLSNSIASNKTWEFVREWLMKKIRLVALFDLPPNVFAETGVNTTIIVGYKPSPSKLEQLTKNNYSVFVREINNVGYTKTTSNRNVIFEPNYLLDENTFETVINQDGESVLNEDFTAAVREFREWCLFQETELKKLFVD